MRWLIKWYPVGTAQEFKVWCLDVLNINGYCSKNYINEVQSELEEYEVAIDIINHGKKFHRQAKHNRDIIAFNNKWMGILDAGNIQDAISYFWEGMKEDINGTRN